MKFLKYFSPSLLGLGRQSLAFQRKIVAVTLIDHRTLYSPAAMGLDGYIHTRERIHTQFSEMGDRFRKKMKEFVAPESINMVFTEDLKHMIHLADNTEEDMELVEEMILKFNKQNRDLRFGSFIFGPVIMRMYHHLNKPKEALKAFLNPDLDHFFDQMISFQLLMDLLFKNEMYDEVLQVMDVIKNKQLQGNMYPKNTVVLAMAAAYKKNTPEALEYMKKLWAELMESGHQPMRRAVTFAAALAINQGEPHIALEMLSSLARQNYVTVRNLKVSALADVGRADDAIPILRSVLEEDTAKEHKNTFCSDVIEKMKAAVNRSDRKETHQEFERVLQQLTQLGHVVDETLESQLCVDIERVTPFTQQSQLNQRMVSARFSGQQRDGMRERDRSRGFINPPRRSLSDME